MEDRRQTHVKERDPISMAMLMCKSKSSNEGKKTASTYLYIFTTIHFFSLYLTL